MIRNFLNNRRAVSRRGYSLNKKDDFLSLVAPESARFIVPGNHELELDHGLLAMGFSQPHYPRWYRGGFVIYSANDVAVGVKTFQHNFTDKSRGRWSEGIRESTRISLLGRSFESSELVGTFDYLHGLAKSFADHPSRVYATALPEFKMGVNKDAHPISTGERKIPSTIEKMVGYWQILDEEFVHRNILS